MTRRGRFMRGGLAALAGAWMLASPASTMPAPSPQAPAPGMAQPPWSFQLEWNQTGNAPNYYRLCIDGNVPCTVLSDAQNAEGDVWRAALPPMPPGEHRLVLEACVFEGCVPGVPDLVIRVSEPSRDGPPIDVIEDPPTVPR